MVLAVVRAAVDAASFTGALRFAVPRAAGFATTVLRAAFWAVVWRGLPFAARRAFPGAAVRVCRDIENSTPIETTSASRLDSLKLVKNQRHQGLDKTRK